MLRITIIAVALLTLPLPAAELAMFDGPQLRVVSFNPFADRADVATFNPFACVNPECDCLPTCKCGPDCNCLSLPESEVLQINPGSADANQLKATTTPVKDAACGWKKGPMPAGTWNWGGVVVVGESPDGFHFADFHGDHVTVEPGTQVERKVSGDKIAWYNNSLDLPPRSTADPKPTTAATEVVRGGVTIRFVGDWTESQKQSYLAGWTVSTPTFSAASFGGCSGGSCGPQQYRPLTSFGGYSGGSRCGPGGCR